MADREGQESSFKSIVKHIDHQSHQDIVFGLKKFNSKPVWAWGLSTLHRLDSAGDFITGKGLVKPLPAIKANSGDFYFIKE